MIALAVFRVVQAGTSLRCATASLKFYAQLMGWPYRAPSHTPVRDWMLRCGYQAVLDTRQLKSKFVLIIDESIQIGKEKLLLLLGVKLEADRSRAYQAEQHVMSHKATTFIKWMDGYFEQHARLLEKHRRLLCCSDIIESTFGRHKNKGEIKAIRADVFPLVFIRSTSP